MQKYGSSQEEVVILADSQTTLHPDEYTEDEMDASQAINDDECPLQDEDMDDLHFERRTLYPLEYSDDSSDSEEHSSTESSSDSSSEEEGEYSHGLQSALSSEPVVIEDNASGVPIAPVAVNSYDDITGAIRPYPGTADDGYSDYYELEREKKPQKKQYEGPIPANRSKKRHPYTDDNCEAPDFEDTTEVAGLKQTLKETLVLKNGGSTVEQLMKLLIHLQVVYKLPTAAMTGVMKLLHSLHPGLNFPKSYPMLLIYYCLQVQIQHNRELRLGVQIKEHHLCFMRILPGDNGEMLRQQGVSVRAMPSLQMSLLRCQRQAIAPVKLRIDHLSHPVLGSSSCPWQTTFPLCGIMRSSNHLECCTFFETP
jgi:hypothetical protein